MDNAAVRSLCPQRHEHSPPTTQVPSTARSLLLPLPSVALRLAITLHNLRKEWHPGFWGVFFPEQYNILWFAVMFFFLLNCERTRKNLSEVSWATSKLLHTRRSSYVNDVFPTFSQQRPAAHPKDNRRLLTDYINSPEPEGKTDRASRIVCLL